jgi:hypothetical protein
MTILFILGMVLLAGAAIFTLGCLCLIVLFLILDRIVDKKPSK